MSDPPSTREPNLSTLRADLARDRSVVYGPLPAPSLADRRQIELMRDASPQRRFALARSLSGQTLGLSHRAIERANPRLGLWERRAAFVEVQYGAALAAGYRRWLAARGLISP